MELVDTTDLKSVGCISRAGSSPAPGTEEKRLLIEPFFISAGIAIGDTTNSVVTTHYAPDTIETQRMVSEQINAQYNHIIRGNA